MMEKVYKQDIRLSHIHTDRFGRLTPAALLYLVQEVSGDHCHLLGADGDALGKPFWAISRTKVEVAQLPKLGQTLTLETWPMPTTRVAYPRSVVAYDKNHNELFRSISLWVLMDDRTRSMILPGKSGVMVDGTITGLELAVPHAIATRPMDNQRTRTVGFSLLDCNGHMNNTRYMNWVDDLLPAAFHRDHPITELTLCYLSEAREGQFLELSWELPQPDTLQVDAHREKTDVPGQKERIFSAKIGV